MLLAPRRALFQLAIFDVLLIERFTKSALDQTLPDVLHRFGATTEGRSNSSVCPAKPFSVGFEKDVRSSNFLRSPFEFLDDSRAGLTFLSRSVS